MYDAGKFFYNCKNSFKISNTFFNSNIILYLQIVKDYALDSTRSSLIQEERSWRSGSSRCNNKFEIALSAGHPIASICSCSFSSSTHRCHLTLQHSAVIQSSRSTRHFRQKADRSSVAKKMFLLNELLFLRLRQIIAKVVLRRLC